MRPGGRALLLAGALSLACLGGGDRSERSREPLKLAPVEPAADPPPVDPGFRSELPVAPIALRAEECDQVDTLAPPADGCVTARLKCGDSVLGHTAGGSANRYDTRFYEKHFCTPATTHHDRFAERVYRLDVPDGDLRAIVTLDTPCADLDLAAVKSTDRTCLEDGASDVLQCEMSVWDEDREQVELVTRVSSMWWIVVEGKDGRGGADAPYGLTVTCVPGLVGSPL